MSHKPENPVLDAANELPPQPKTREEMYALIKDQVARALDAGQVVTVFILSPDGAAMRLISTAPRSHFSTLKRLILITLGIAQEKVYH